MRTRTATWGLIGAAVIMIAVVSLVIGEAPAGPGSDGVVELTIAGFSFKPNAVVITAERPVTIRLSNPDVVDRPVTFGRSIMEQNGRAQGFREDLFAGLDPAVDPAGAIVGDGPQERAFTVIVEAGSSVSIDATLPADRIGEWQASCFTAGCRYEPGLPATITVEPPS